MLDPKALRPHYARFLRGKDDHALLTGHSHQAWPDAAREGMLEAFDDAAALVDDKWGRAFEAADAVRRCVAEVIGAEADEIALGQNTHELVTRFLSALDWRRRRHVVTTAGEFHSLYRQLSRLAEEGLEVTWVDPDPLDTLTERIAAEVRDDTAAVMCSNVLFETSSIVPHLELATEAARAHGAEMLLDAYHSFMNVPFTVPAGVWLTSGGYKYAQWGEATCFLRVPKETTLRPVYTGWFADFAHLAAPRDGQVHYGARPADRFAGSTYDPVSHYRARAVIRFFEAQGMTVEALRASYLRQTARLIEGLDGYDVRTPREDARRGGFVTVEIDDASRVVAALRERDVHTDARGRMLRFGPAPYVTDDEIDRAIAALREVAPR
ncbi:MAG: aminotransferase class V-fold PLP-dependent enzyme [Sandaracinaceae bacterium]|nr:MAG: aminotransferase class V-fold PLP-dependent enzyme [Sandaracinaceae bacterium]